MARNLIIIGTGDYYSRLVAPAVVSLREQGFISSVTTIDLEEKERSLEVKHVVRQPRQAITELVDSLGLDEPAIILSHANELHAVEAQELLGASSKPIILIEKPYAIHQKDLVILRDVINRGGDRVGLLEYYLLMKGIPLLAFGGVIKQDSFYFEDNGILKSPRGNIREYAGKMKMFIGQPLFVLSDILEGEGSYGTIDHRNFSLVDRRLGGGMIQDLGHHAITALMGLENILGSITKESLRDVRVATCTEYLQSSLHRGIPEFEVGESYAEMSLETSTGVPVKVSLGKYVEEGQNQRRVVIVGTKGIVTYDMTNNVLAFQHGDSTMGSGPLLEADKRDVPKYLAVLRGGLEIVEGRNPFLFDPTEVCYRAQEIVLAALEAHPSQNTTYRQGQMHDTIF